MTRYGMPTDKALGVPVNAIQRLARSIGPNQALALALWDTGWYEARMVAAYVGEPARLTPVQMDRWCREFDNWGICDTVCFVLFDRTPHAWGRIPKWARQT
jgi:3-methyladenine DNA glycosylase AlkD